MSYLTVRAEQALIGAMLADQPLPAEFDYLQPESFGHRTLRDIFTAVLRLRTHHHGEDLLHQVALGVDRAGVDVESLEHLRDACPSAEHIAAYARMVQVCGFRRAMAQHGERIAATMAAGTPTDQTQSELSAMAQALGNQADAYRAFTVIDEQQALLPGNVGLQVPGAAEASQRSAREDQLLADLLAHPEQATTVARIVPPETFTSDQRREVFMTLVTLAADGQPIDEIILLWELEQLRAVADLYGPDSYGNTYRADQHSEEPNTAYVTRLAAMAVAGATAVAIGHELVVDDTRRQLQAGAVSALERNTREADIAITDRTDVPAQLDPDLSPPGPDQRGVQPTIDR
jgi:replicative DNA helicase